MKKNKISLGTEILNILLICLVNYIVMSKDSSSLFVNFVASLVLAVTLCASSSKKASFYTVFGVLMAFIIYCASFTFSDTAFIVNGVIRVADLYLPAYVLQLCFKSTKAKIGTTVYLVSGANLLVTILDLAKIKYIDKINTAETLEASIGDMIEDYMAVIDTNAVFKDIGAERINELFDSVCKITVMLLPAFYIISCIIISYIFIISVRGMLKVYLKEEHEHIEHFYQISVGRMFSNITLILILLAMISGNSYFTAAVYNFAVIAGFIYLINGIAVVYFLMIKKTRNKYAGLILTIALMIFSVISVVTMPSINGFTIMFLIGLLDSSVNFRKLKRVGE